jgi:hypothetical protein
MSTDILFSQIFDQPILRPVYLKFTFSPPPPSVFRVDDGLSKGIFVQVILCPSRVPPVANASEPAPFSHSETVALQTVSCNAASQIVTENTNVEG